MSNQRSAIRKTFTDSWPLKSVTLMPENSPELVRDLMTVGVPTCKTTTPVVDIARFLIESNVEELVGAAIFLSSKGASFVNGHTLYVDGGITASL